jgi:hypothetical protein
MIAKMMRDGEGLCFIDPHGQSARAVVGHIPLDRKDDLIFIDLADPNYAPGLNFLTDISLSDRPLAAANLVASFKHVYAESWGPRMEYVFYCAVRSLMDSNLTLLALPRLFVEPIFRARIVRAVKDPFVRYFWHQQFPAWLKKFGPDLSGPIDNKVGAVLASPALRTVLAQHRSTLSINEIMDTRKILIVSLSKGQVGEEPSKLFGALLVSAIAQAAFARASVAEPDRVPFTLICDEFQNFAASGFPLILSEARKYRLQLVLAHQGLFQTPPDITNAVFANCGTFITFRIGIDDAPILTRNLQFQSHAALLDLPNYHAWIRPLENGNPGSPRRIATAPPETPLHINVNAFIVHSQRVYCRRKVDIEKKIGSFLDAA